MRRPLCGSCQREFKPVKNGVNVLGYASNGEPYTITQADEFECPNCNTKIIVGFGYQPYMRREDDGFQREIEVSKLTGLLRHNLTGIVEGK